MDLQYGIFEGQVGLMKVISDAWSPNGKGGKCRLNNHAPQCGLKAALSREATIERALSQIEHKLPFHEWYGGR